ncbi:hypothetical protein, partial [Klebsiella pneumoniae]|uniref:hypothetical protein n=1 Tax=Klebsiella pneumoniae TaxID=573 RepID=UPI001C8F41FB
MLKTTIYNATTLIIRLVTLFLIHLPEADATTNNPHPTNPTQQNTTPKIELFTGTFFHPINN